MAAIFLLPGMGGKYTSQTFVDTDTVAADTIDCSRCAQLLVQVVWVSGSPAGTFILENSNDGVVWASLGSAIDVSTNGTMSRFDVTDGPFGLIRLNPTGLTTGTFYATLVGFPIQAFN